MKLKPGWHEVWRFCDAMPVCINIVGVNELPGRICFSDSRSRIWNAPPGGPLVSWVVRDVVSEIRSIPPQECGRRR